ncbi:hypothetical protein RB25_04595 [Herbaspirillum rubrisubalbicans]|jgi:hypothetical protein|uniref:Lipoprotein n=2 Tax=Herbaspirillum rubrisubalbicans TaxID=80842 RepID=A0ABX9BWK9_9BURK|nr:hypothetical protein [Herbaspirillum rubrisubalbicans]MCP1576776.1 hypothetical protein [Herbaspirillum rubrisubalbicans]QJQ00008.1 hypothetical protein C798_07115 [Herbaspirillum rubrisubalbicans Os34]RAM62315.1 hypothetical protein RB24_21265 [Herbaspirillum rubrisubalbicans]RAN49660.1 hypothetical protein RB25_04595 [Herbaspirillum rubrisubalbicans]
MSASSSQAPRLWANLALICAVSLSLSACDYVSSFSKPKQTPEEAKAEGIALGAGCRQAGQSLEDCYQRNPDALKAGIFAGWKDMHEYMAAKGIQTVTPPAPAADATKDDGKGKDGKDKDAKDSDRSSRSRDRDSSRDNARSRDRESSSSSRDASSDRRASRDEKTPPKY